MRQFLVVTVALCLMLATSPVRAGESYLGTPHVIDGATLAFEDGVAVHLAGIDAPAYNQTCTGPKGEAVKCGELSADALQELIGEYGFVCERLPRPKCDYEAKAVCTYAVGAQSELAGLTLNELQVRAGWAISQRGEPLRYDRAERQAKAHKVGLWAMRFDRPDIWRTSHHQSEINKGCWIDD